MVYSRGVLQTGAAHFISRWGYLSYYIGTHRRNVYRLRIRFYFLRGIINPQEWAARANLGVLVSDSFIFGGKVLTFVEFR